MAQVSPEWRQPSNRSSSIGAHPTVVVVCHWTPDRVLTCDRMCDRFRPSLHRGRSVRPTSRPPGGQDTATIGGGTAAARRPFAWESTRRAVPVACRTLLGRGNETAPYAGVVETDRIRYRSERGNGTSSSKLNLPIRCIVKISSGVVSVPASGGGTVRRRRCDARGGRRRRRRHRSPRRWRA